MDSPIVIRGTFLNQVFVPEGPLPNIEGRAELIVYPRPRKPAAVASSSIFDLLGKAPHLRSAEDIDAQLQAERDSRDEP
jgi:hypothetical protein